MDLISLPKHSHNSTSAQILASLVVYMLARKVSFIPRQWGECHQTKTWQWVQGANSEPGSCLGFPLGTATEAPVGLVSSECQKFRSKQNHNPATFHGSEVHSELGESQVMNR